MTADDQALCLTREASGAFRPTWAGVDIELHGGQPLRAAVDGAPRPVAGRRVSDVGTSGRVDIVWTSNDAGEEVRA